MLHLPYKNYHFTLYCDNYFLNIPLFQVLREYGIGACGTVQPNSAEFPSILKIDKKKSQLPWGFLSGVKVRDVLALVWQDNNLVRLLTTAHLGGEKDCKERNCRRPRETPRNRESVQQVWGDSARKTLFVPSLTADYNDKMGGVDIADQLRANYPTQLRVGRNWMPISFWLLDTTLINCYLLARECYPGERAYNKNNRWKWHEDLAWDLVLEGYSELNPSRSHALQNNIPCQPNGRHCPNVCPLGNTQLSRQSGYVTKNYQLPICRLQGGKHLLERSGRQRLCVFCRFLHSRHISPNLVSSLQQHPQAPDHFKVRQSLFQCQLCKLPLCKQFCFKMFHEL